jgi:sugar-phosphatase
VATARLKSLGLPVPAVLVTAEDVVNGKPDSEPYHLAANALGVPAEQCVVVEDSPAGIAAAGGAGMRSVAIASTHAAHELASATVVVSRLSELRVERGVDGCLVIRLETG